MRCPNCNKNYNMNQFSFRNIKSKKRIWMCKKCVSKYNRNYREKNCLKIKENKHKYHQDNKDSINKKNREYYQEHKKERLQYRKNYYKQNKDKEAKYMRNYEKERMKSDPAFRLTKIITKRIRNSIKYNKELKNINWKKLLGQTIKSTRIHIEKQFYKHPETGEEMSWENYGKWEIDHKIPVSTIKYGTNKSQIKKVFNYKNLRPLWKEANSNKRAKLKWNEKTFWKNRRASK